MCDVSPGHRVRTADRQTDRQTMSVSRQSPELNAELCLKMKCCFIFKLSSAPSPTFLLLQAFVSVMNIQMSRDVITLYNYSCPWWWRRHRGKTEPDELELIWGLFSVFPPHLCSAAAHADVAVVLYKALMICESITTPFGCTASTKYDWGGGRWNPD